MHEILQIMDTEINEIQIHYVFMHVCMSFFIDMIYYNFNVGNVMYTKILSGYNITPKNTDNLCFLMLY